jgi:glucosyl-dolichyl phosphate glucuronosyltransferase
MNQGTLFSIIICSHNRSDDLSECVASVVPQLGGQAELIVVDSASGPEEQAKARNLVPLYPDLKLVRVDQPGLSLARNSGVRQAAGEWVIFLDDDVIPFADWASQLERALEGAPLNQAVIGGGIIPRWPKGVNGRNLSKRWKMFLSLAEDEKPGKASEGAAVNGANYAIRRRVLSEIGGFPENLGRIGQSLISGDEAHVTQRALDAGWEVDFDPSFKVYHKISSERLTMSWILRRTYWEGFSAARVFRSRAMAVPSSMGIFKLISSLPLLFIFSIIFFRDDDWKMRLAMCLGSCVSILKSAATGATGEGQASRQRLADSIPD